MNKPMSRAEILAAAKRCVCGDREEDYGSPENNFQTIADMWTAYTTGCKRAGRDMSKGFTAIDVAMMLIDVKMARIASGHAKMDNWIDLAGYAACGGELESKGVKWQEQKRDTAEETPSPGFLKGLIPEGTTLYSPCTVVLYDDDSFQWQEGDNAPIAITGKQIKRVVHDCTVEAAVLTDGRISYGWWENSKPPIDLSHVWVTDDD